MNKPIVKVKVQLPNDKPRYGFIKSRGNLFADVVYYDGNTYSTKTDVVFHSYMTVLTDEEYDEAIILDKLTDGI